VFLWWVTNHGTKVQADDGVTSTALRKRLVAPAPTLMPNHFVYRTLMPRQESEDGMPPIGVVEHVRQIREQRGDSLAIADRELALEVLAGKVTMENVSGDDFHWLADEILTGLRLQEPPQPGLAKDLATIAANPGTDPVIRSYIIQHLVHIWEQRGPEPQLAQALWSAVDSIDAPLGSA